MAITLTGDPIMALEDAYELFDVKGDARPKLLVNALTRKFLAFTGRVQLNYNGETAITERLRGTPNSRRLWVHGAPIDTALAVSASVYYDGSVDEVYTLAGGDLQVIQNSDAASAIELIEADWPDDCSSSFIELSYFGGWATVPGDVLQGAVLQGKVDLDRMAGEVGVSERSRDGESTSFDTASIIKPVRELWMPYKVLR